ncbi:hypothetical protein D7D52_08485 [Nocardia yunnanensis]|uniref:Uncharacterized protein n=1 Tax=Nocardia yunnanensis TaxID=2382165 RepID=A0A386Z9W1_9NOCA|nr:hypothetical protein [Nocardia yunnanensis]AYF73894.1 hypothetical protein D7D52_08485 [Nocardia yunnanensis]
MSDILDVLHARWAEAVGDAILTGDEHPTLTLATHEAADAINHISDLRRATADAVAALDRIRVTLEQRTAHPESQAHQARTIARHAAETLAAAHPAADEQAR